MFTSNNFAKFLALILRDSALRFSVLLLGKNWIRASNGVAGTRSTFPVSFSFLLKSRRNYFSDTQKDLCCRIAGKQDSFHLYS